MTPARMATATIAAQSPTPTARIPRTRLRGVRGRDGRSRGRVRRAGEGIEEDPVGSRPFERAASSSTTCAASTARPSPTCSRTRHGGRGAAWPSSSATTSEPVSWTKRWPPPWRTRPPQPPWSPRPDARPRRRWPRPSRSTSARWRWSGPGWRSSSRETVPPTACRSSSRPTPGRRRCPLTKVASGGELARAMLALRLVLTAGPPTLVFDEVDAGIGGAAALAVGRSLPRWRSTSRCSSSRTSRRWPRSPTRT